MDSTSSEVQPEVKPTKISDSDFWQAIADLRRARDPDYDRRYRADDLASFALLGLDIKITPDGKVKIIEVNGQNSGTGFKGQSREHYQGMSAVLHECKQMSLPYSQPKKKHGSGSDLFEEAISAHFRTLGNIPLEYLAAHYLVRNRVYPWSTKVSGVQLFFPETKEEGKEGVDGFNDAKTFARAYAYPEWEQRFGRMARIFANVTWALGDKYRSDDFFEDCRQLKERTVLYQHFVNPGELKGIERDLFNGTNKVVVKPNDGERGIGVKIFDLSDPKLYQLKEPENDELIIEAFVPSKPIRSDKTGADHDGCMRYVVIVEENHDGEIKLYHFGGIWRLCLDPLEEKPTLRNSRASFSRGAHAQRVSEEDLLLVKRTLDEHLPSFYRNLVEYADFSGRRETGQPTWQPHLPFMDN